MMLQDEAYERRMLATFETSGSAHLGPGRLMGTNSGPMNAICKDFPINAQGRFV